jgi:hypothetical protein
LRGKPRDGEKGCFLGGARSPRPRGKALLMPGHFITRGEWPGGRGLMETCLGQAQAFFNGRAEPAPPRGASLGGRPCGGNPGDNVEGCFLGGARSPRPRWKALLMPRHFITRGEWPGGRGLMETCLGQAQAFFNGRAEPAPPRGASLAERPWAENPGIMWRAVFSERCEAVRKPGHGMTAGR